MAVVVSKTKGYSGSDVHHVCTEAAMGPIRSLPLTSDIRNIDVNDVRPITIDDFHEAIRGVKPSVAQKDLKEYLDWNNEFGSFRYDPAVEGEEE